LPGPMEDPPLVSQHAPEERAYVEAYEGVGRPALMVQVQRADAASADETVLATLLTDLLSANGQVSVLSPMSKEKATNVDVLVHVALDPIAGHEKDGRLVAEAVNTRGGESIGRAVADVPLPLEKQALDDAARFTARKLMNGLTSSWKRMSVGMPPTHTPLTTAPAPLAHPSTRPQ
jgi:hypothetical protein